MILSPVVLDADMRAEEVLARLARHGIWEDEDHPAVQARLAALRARWRQAGLADKAQRAARADRLDMRAEAQRLHRDTSRYGAAIRQRRGARVAWHARAMREVLARCLAAPPDAVLGDVMALAADRDASPMDANEEGDVALRTGVLLQDGLPVGVSLVPWSPFDEPFAARARRRPEPTFRGEPAAAMPAGPGAALDAWPWLDAPDRCQAGEPFTVTAALSDQTMAGASAPMHLQAEAGAAWIDLDVVLMAGQGVATLSGWQQPMRVMLDDPFSARAAFQLVGLDPPDGAASSLTMLELRYVRDGVVCGAAARPLLIQARVPGSAQPSQAPRDDEGGDDAPSGAAPMQAVCAPMAWQADAAPPDLTIEIAKPDRDAAQGHYVCRMDSPHALATPLGPVDMDLGDDARTFASQMADELRLHADDPLAELVMESNGRLVASRLPPTVMQALQEVALQVAPAVPAVLIVSAEPYVPWELAWLDPPLDASRPAYLGAQVLLGRWLRTDLPAAADGKVRPRPALQPQSSLTVRHLAAMAAWYQADSGLVRLPMAEDEVGRLAIDFGARALDATADALRQILTAALPAPPGDDVAPDAVHFAGHGDVDIGLSEGSALFLSDGKPISAKVFRAARYGGEHQPLLFLNACMLGIGGDLLGSSGGFPGHSLHGGFGAVLGALWAVDDQVAHDLALAFWRRAWPTPDGPGEPIAAILRELRAQYASGGPDAPGRATYLAYVYYGHPRLRLHPAGGLH